LKKKAYVVGGGPLGLSAAFELARRGLEVHLIDRGKNLGGLTEPFDFDGVMAEKYYHFFYWNDSAWAESFLEKVGTPGDVEWKDIRSKTFFRGRFVDFDSPLKVLSLAGRSFLKTLWTLLKLKFRAPPLSLDKQSALRWAERQFGAAFSDTIWRPLLTSKFGSHASNISALWLASRLRRHMSTQVGRGNRCRFGYLKGTYAPAIHAVGRIVTEGGGRLRLGSGLRSISFSEDLVSGLSLDSGEYIPIAGEDLVFSALPFHDLKELPGIVERLPYLADFDGVGAIVYMIKLSEHLSDAYWTTVTDPEIDFNVVIQQNLLFENAPEKVVYMSRYLEKGDPRLSSWDDREIRSRFVKGLQRIYPGFQESMILADRVFKPRSAAPVPRIDTFANLPSYETRYRNFFHGAYEQIFPEDRGVGNSIHLGAGMVEAALGEPQAKMEAGRCPGPPF
jgi:protoporphyrinogen oxidase